MPQLLLFFITGRFRTYLFPSDLLKWNLCLARLSFDPKLFHPTHFWSCLPAVVVAVMQVLSVASSLCFLRRSTTTAFSISVTAKVNLPTGFQQSNPKLNLNHKFMSGGPGRWPRFRRDRGEAVDVAGLSPPSHRRECSESGESGVERQGQGDSCRTPRPYHLDGK